MLSQVACITLAAALALAGCAGRAVVEAEPDAGAGGAGGGAGGSGGTMPNDGGVEDAAPPLDAGPAVLCPMDGAVTVAVAGTTPLGKIDLKYGWVGHLGGECGGRRVGLSAVPTLEPKFWTTPSPPSFEFGAPYTPMTGYVSAAEVPIDVAMNGQTVTTQGWVEITRADPLPPDVFVEGMEYPRFEGTIKIDAPGWNVSGSFTARYCQYMDILCP
jgi:hypothetical protein